jgi:hypothetical protein
LTESPIQVLEKRVTERLHDISSTAGLDGPVAVLIRGLVDVLMEQMVNVEANVKQVEFALAKALKPIVGLSDEVNKLRVHADSMESCLNDAVAKVEALQSGNSRICSDIQGVNKSFSGELAGTAAMVGAVAKSVSELKKTAQEIKKKKIDWDGKEVIAQAMSTVLDKLDNLPVPKPEVRLDGLEAKFDSIAKQLARPRKVVRDRDGRVAGWKLGE